MQEKKTKIYVADKDFSVTEVVENIYNVAVKIAPCDVKCTLDGGCGEKHSADGPLAASTATSAALLATTCV